MPFTGSEKEIIVKVKRRESILRALGRLLGILSVIALVAVTVVVIRKKIKARPGLEVDYIEKKYGVDGTAIPHEPVTQKDIAAGLKQMTTKPEVVDMSSRNDEKGRPVKPKDYVDMSSTRKVDNAASAKPSTSVGIQNLESKQPAIASVVKSFFAASSTMELVPLVRDAGRVRPLMEEYYARLPLTKREWKGLGWVMPVEEPGYRFAYVQALFENAAPVNVVVEETDLGFFVDWESSVHYSELGWKDFQSKKPEEPKMFRVLASRSDEAVAPGGGADQNAALTLRHPQEDGVVHAHFDRNDPRFRPLLEQLDLCQWKDVPVTLRLCYPGPSSSSTEVKIAGVEGKGWLILGAQPHS